MIIQDLKEFDRVKWAINRGMLELDLILEPYVNNYYLKSTNDEKLEFINFLKSEDQDLFNWLLKKEKSVKYDKIINKILEVKKNSLKM